MAAQNKVLAVPLVREYMTRDVVSIDADANALELQQLLGTRRVTGCPVVEQGRLVGVVSRSDLARHLLVVRARAEELSDYYRDPQVPPEAALDEIASLSGHLMQSVRVADLMATRLIAVKPDDAITVAAQRMLEHHVHRVLVIEDGRLQGVLTSQDLTRAIAAGSSA